MGLDPRFDAWIESGHDAIARAGTDGASLRAAHDVHGPVAVAAGQAMIAEWLQGLE
jgi:GMP synthase (glutamine-hydrolysing)